MGDLGDVGVDSIRMLENQWYETLLAIDGYYGCVFFVWQVDNPQNRSFFACDLSDMYRSIGTGDSTSFWAGINLWTHASEVAVELESVSVFEFTDFFGSVANGRGTSQRYTYHNDAEKYRLAVQLFNEGDYYNANLLLQELVGYSTSSSYREECERLLVTVPLKGWALANGVIRSMLHGAVPKSPYLYIFQAEALETLDLSGWEITDLGFLRYFPNLKELILDDNMITDLMPLKDL